MWSHLLPLASPDIHDVDITGSASKPYAYIALLQSLTKVHSRKRQMCLCDSPAVEAGPGEAGGVSPLDEPSSAVAPPVA